jgi:hypothetical protein
VPDGAAQVRAESLESIHPQQGQFPQRAQFGGLGVGTKNGDVFAYRSLQDVVVGQGRARRQAELAQGTALGRAVILAFVDHQARSHGSDFGGGVVSGKHCAIVPRASP